MQFVSEVEGFQVSLNNLDKVYWPREGITKGDLLNYYHQVAPYLLPHLRDRPVVLQRFPDGISGHSFYQKECPSGAPTWVETIPISSFSGKSPVIDFVLCNNEAALLWLVNLGCIEMHPWLSQVDNLDYPNYLVFDLDPHGEATFTDVMIVALFVKEALDGFGLRSYPKLSGSTGIHIYVPVKPVYAYKQIRQAAIYLAELVAKIYPEKVTLERSLEKRGNRVYMDCLQNGKGKTIASVYSVRPKEGAPVSLPINWDQVKKGQLQPNQFSMSQIPNILQTNGDLFLTVLQDDQSIHRVLGLLPN